jgi:hypothetical protein
VNIIDIAIRNNKLNFDNMCPYICYSWSKRWWVKLKLINKNIAV